MILLDTNVVSETMRPRPDSKVLGWLDGQDTETLFLCAITIAEIEFGLQSLPLGKRRESLRNQFHRFLTQGFDSRILSFEAAAARHYGELMGHRRRLGQPMSVLDGQIAAIARCRGFALATRNTRDFEDCGCDLINPF